MLVLLRLGLPSQTDLYFDKSEFVRDLYMLVKAT